MIKDVNILNKYNKIQDKIIEKLSIKFHSKPVYDQKHIKAKVREFDVKIKTKFLGNRIIPKENMHYTCITCITIDSVMKIERKNYPHVHLEECKYRAKKIQMSRFINAELESDSKSDSEIESKSETKLIAKSKSDSGSDYEYDIYS